MTFDIKPWHDPAYQRFRNAGGAVYISVCSEAEDTDACHRTALAHVVAEWADTSYPKEDGEEAAFAALRGFEIDEETFHGPGFHLGSRGLYVDGFVMTKWGEVLKRPYYADLSDSYRGRSGSIPHLWAPGGFAHAFNDPPYGLALSYREKQALYLEIVSQVAPFDGVRIMNWHQDGLLDALPDLHGGQEWWGIFAFTTYVPAVKRVFAMVASETD